MNKPSRSIRALARGGLTSALAFFGNGAPPPVTGFPGIDSATPPGTATVPGKGPWRTQKPAVTLTDPRNAESELEPGSVADDDQWDPSDEEKAQIALVEERHRDSCAARRPHEGRWMESLAFFNSNQWSAWNGSTAKLQSLRSPDPADSDRVYTVHNVIYSKARKLVARGMGFKTTATIRPYSKMQSDILAAQGASSVLAHIDNLHDLPTQMMSLHMRSVVIGPHYLELFFDRDAIVPTPSFDDSMNITGIEDSPVGEIKSKIRSCFEVCRDPKAREWGDDAWLIVDTFESLTYLRDTYANGKHVKGEGDNGPSSQVENILNNLTGDISRSGSDSGSKSARLKRMYEKPSTTYPKGRFIHVANGVLLWSGPWPYPKLDIFPVSPMVYEEGLETPYGNNALSVAIEPQRGRNRTLSAMYEHTKNGDGKLLVPGGCEVSPNSFKSGRRNEIVAYTVDPLNMGAKPEFMAMPALDPIYAEMLQICDADIADAMQVHDVSEASVPTGIEAAAAIQSLQDADRSDSVITQANTDLFHRVRARIITAIAAQCYSEPRLVMVGNNDASAQDDATSRLTERLKRMEAMIAVLKSGGVPPDQIPELLESAPSMQDVAQQNQGMPPQGVPPAIARTGTPPGATMPRPGSPLTPGPVPMGAQMPVPGGPPASLPGANGGADVIPGAPAGDSDSDVDDGQGQDLRGNAATRVLVTRNLSQGRYLVEVSSSMSRTPAARIQTILDMAKQGMFTPDQLPSTIVLLKIMEIEQSDKLTQDLLSVLEELDRKSAAAMPDPAALAAQKSQQDAEALAAVSHARMEEYNSRSQADLQRDIAKIDAQAKANAQAPTKISLSGSLPTAAVLAAAEEAGIDVPSAASFINEVAAKNPHDARPFGHEPLPPAKPAPTTKGK